MALIKCSECGHEVSNKASFCPNCGNPLKTRNWKSNFMRKTILASIVFLIMILSGFVAVSHLPTTNIKIAKNHDETESNSATNSKEETQQLLEEETKEREHKAIVGTYFFNARKENYASVDMYNGQKWWKERKLIGYIEWTEYLVVMADKRVSLLRPSQRNFVGTVSDIDNGAFVISINSCDNASVGAWTTLYRNGKDIGHLGDKGYGYPKSVVIDTKTKRIYNGVQDYKNKDISDVEYIMYDRFSSAIEESNTTEIRRNYLSQEYEREYGR